MAILRDNPRAARFVASRGRSRSIATPSENPRDARVASRRAVTRQNQQVVAGIRGIANAAIRSGSRVRRVAPAPAPAPSTASRSTTRAAAPRSAKTGGTPSAAPAGRPAKTTKAPKRTPKRTPKGPSKGPGKTTPDKGSGESTTPSMFDAARRQLDTQLATAQAQRAARVAEMEKFNQYMAQARQAAQGTLQTQFDQAQNALKIQQDAAAQRAAQSAQNAAAAGQAGSDSIYAMSGGATTDMNAALRADASQAAQDRMLKDQQALATRAADRTGEDSARANETTRYLNQLYDKTSDKISGNRLNIDVEEAKAKAAAEQAELNRQADREALNAAMQVKMGNLAVAQTNAQTQQYAAQTGRLNSQIRLRQINNAASLNAAKLKLDQAYKAGLLSAKQADRQLQLAIANGKLSMRQKELAQRARAEWAKALGKGTTNIQRGSNAIATAAGKLAQSGSTANAARDLQTWSNNRIRGYGTGMGTPSSWSNISDIDREETVKGAMVMLKTKYPGMSAPQAKQILEAQFGGSYFTPQRFGKLVQVHFG